MLSLYLEYGLVVRHSLYTRPIFPPPATATAVSAPRPTRLRVYHSSALRGTSQSSARYLMAALLLQVYHSYQSSSHLPCATQPCLAPSALISFITVFLSSALRDTAVSYSVRPHLFYNMSGWCWSVGCIGSRIAIAQNGQHGRVLD